MMYHVGDRVVIRSDLVASQVYYMLDKSKGDTVTDAMIEYRGKAATISRYENGKYRLKEFSWYWTDEMFEGLESDLSSAVTPSEFGLEMLL